jgi:EAL domain-containing protein (putative c-di-GMP-specific phosphodiesterase class I)
VAEGVETRVQQDILTKLGCDELQGFLLARPGSSAALIEIVQSTDTSTPRETASLGRP